MEITNKKRWITLKTVSILSNYRQVYLRQSGSTSNNYSYTVWYSHHQYKTVLLKQTIKPPLQKPAQEAHHNCRRETFHLHVTSLNPNCAGLPSKSLHSHLLLPKKKSSKKNFISFQSTWISVEKPPIPTTVPTISRGHQSNHHVTHEKLC